MLSIAASPPASPLPAHPGPPSLPAALTSFIGRERELEDVPALIRGGQRLLTLLGPGGAGKTRLALEVGRRLAPSFASGVRLVELAPLRDAAQVVPAISSAIGVESGPGDPTQRLQDYLQHHHLLLLMDNFEHVIDAAPALATLLRACPGVQCIATSRAALRVSGEHEYAVAPLARESATALFVERARAVRPATGALDGPTDDAIDAICARVDRLPLAIELAAARMRIFNPTQLLERMEDGASLALASGGRDRPARQRTLLDTVAWSDALLAPAERTLLARLSVFRGSFTLAAAEAVCGDASVTDVAGALDQLVASSLVQPSPPSSDGAARFALLETVREYAHESLLASGDPSLQDGRHALCYADLCEAAARVLSDLPDPPLGLERQLALERTWINRVRPEQENVRAAFAWGDRAALTLEQEVAAGQPGSEAVREGAELAVRLAAASAGLSAALPSLLPWEPPLDRGERLLRATRSLPATRARERLLAQTVYAARYLAGEQDRRRVRDLAAEWVAAQDAVGIDLTHGMPERQQARKWLAFVEVTLGNRETAASLLEEAAAEARRLPAAHAADWLAGIAFVWRRFESTAPGTPFVPGDADRASAVLAEATAIAETTPDPPACTTVSHVAAILAHTEGNAAEVRRQWEARLAATERLGHTMDAGWGHNLLGTQALFQRRSADARSHFEAARRIFELAGHTQRVTMVLPFLTMALLGEGAVTSAALTMRECLPRVMRHPDPESLSNTLAAAARCLQVSGHTQLAVRLVGALRDSRISMTSGFRTRFARDGVEVLTAARETLDETSIDALLGEGKRASPVALLADTLAALDTVASAPPAAPPSGNGSALSKREFEVAQLIAEGLTNRQIGERLIISERTVENHVQRILNKLALDRRTQVATWITAHATATPASTRP